MIKQAVPGLDVRIAQIQKDLHSQRTLAQQGIDLLLRDTRANHDGRGFVAAVELQSQLATGLSQIDLQYEALQMAQSLRLFATEARLLNLIARAYYTSAQYRLALQNWQRCLECAALSNELGVMAKARMGLGQIYDALEDPESAVRLHREAIETATSIGDKWLLLQGHINLGVNLSKLQQTDAALESYNYALDLARSIGHDDDEAEALMRIGELFLGRQAFARALTTLDAARIGAEKTNYVWVLSQIHYLRARTLLAMKEPQQAMQETLLGINAARSAQASMQNMKLLYLQSEIAEALGDPLQALDAERRGLQIERQIRSRSNVAGELESLSNYEKDQILFDLVGQQAWEHDPLPQLGKTLCRVASNMLQIRSASFWHWQNGAMHCLLRTDAHGQPLNSSAPLPASEYASMLQYLQTGEPLVAHLAAQHIHTWHWSERSLASDGIGAVLAFPLREQECMRSLLVCEDGPGQHNWLRDDIQRGQILSLLACRALAHERPDINVPTC